jgi:hypothetical protein
MNPEMERLLQLFDEARQSRQQEELFESHLDDLYVQHPGLSREQLRRFAALSAPLIFADCGRMPDRRQFRQARDLRGKILVAFAGVSAYLTGRRRFC